MKDVIKKPTPPFNKQTALEKVKLAEDAWNTRDPEKVCLAYTLDSQWRNRNEFFEGREAIKSFLYRKWNKELHYKLMKELWCYTDNRIQLDLSMNGMMLQQLNGCVPMVMNIGNLIAMDS